MHVLKSGVKQHAIVHLSQIDKAVQGKAGTQSRIK
jgi:hypothetical protein